jgi:hypothetical protein
MAKRKKPMSLRLYDEPLLRAIVKLIGYAGIECPISEDAEARFATKHGKEAMKAAAEELVEYDTSKQPIIAKLKPEIRKLCFGILGPAPEQEEWFYADLDGMPKPTAPKATPEPVVSAEQVTGFPGPLTGIEARAGRIRNLEGVELMQRYFKANQILESESEHTGIYRQTTMELDLLTAECNRRGYSLPPTETELEAMRAAKPEAKPTRQRRTVLKKRNAYQDVTAAVANGQGDYATEQAKADAVARATARPQLSPKERQAAADYAEERFPSNVRAMKKQLRVLRAALRITSIDSPARVSLKAEVKRLRDTIGRVEAKQVF